jgi:DNA-binding NarL/FixJ family response regulator
MNPGSLRVLIADYDASARAAARRVLEADKRFCVCAAVADAAEAVRAAIQERPDVCLLEVRMPGSGLAAAWEIAARLPQAKIVILTVSDEDTDLFSALRAGADGYLLKTMNMRHLPDALHGVSLGEAAMPRELVARVLERFHGREPRWRSLADADASQNRLTSREWEVLALLARGYTTAEIADSLVLSASTVRAHITSIVRKLQVADRAAAAELFRSKDPKVHSMAPKAAAAVSPGQEERITEKRRVVPMATPAVGVAAAATRLLPAAERARYGEEYRSELWELAATGAGRRQQIRCAMSQLRCAVPLRFAVLAPRRRKASL